MSGIQRPFPGLASSIHQTPSSTISTLTQIANPNPVTIPSSSASYLTNYSNVNPTNTNTYLDEQNNITRHFPNLDSNITSVDLGAPTQFQTANNSTNSYYPSQRTHTSPSSAASFPQIFGYVPPSFSHHNHHHHLSSNVDDATLLIQNPSLTWSLIFIYMHILFFFSCESKEKREGEREIKRTNKSIQHRFTFNNNRVDRLYFVSVLLHFFLFFF